MSTTAIFATRMLGTVPKVLNRAITARISPLPNLTPRASETVNKLIKTLFIKGFGGYMTKVFTELLAHPQPSPKMVKFFKRLHYVKFFRCLVQNKI